MLFKIILSYTLVYIVWGSTYYFIKIGVATIPPMYLVGSRFVLGGIALISYALLVNGNKWRSVIPGFKQILSASLIGLLLLVGGNGLVTVGEMKVDSYMAALIVGTVPIFVLVFDMIILNKKVFPLSFFGAITGVAGTWLLLNNGNKILPDINLSIALILFAVVSWAFGTTLSKKVPLPQDVIMNTGIQSLVAGIIALTFWDCFQPLSTVSIYSISRESWFALAYLTVVGSIAFCAYSFILKHEPNHRVVTYSLVNPVIAVLLGIWIGKEKPVPFLVPGIVLVLAGLFFLFYGERMLRFFNKRVMTKNGAVDTE